MAAILQTAIFGVTLLDFIIFFLTKGAINKTYIEQKFWRRTSSPGHNVLTHLPLDKMAAISQTFSKAFSWMKGFQFFIKYSLKFVLYGPIDNNLVLV